MPYLPTPARRSWSGHESHPWQFRTERVAIDSGVGGGVDDATVAALLHVRQAPAYFVATDVGKDDGGAFLGEAFRGCRADAARGSGDNGHPSVKCARVPPCEDGRNGSCRNPSALTAPAIASGVRAPSGAGPSAVVMKHCVTERPSPPAVLPGSTPLTRQGLAPRRHRGVAAPGRSLAQKRGAHRLWLVTTNDNTAALRFYQRVAFDLAALPSRPPGH
jgi:hypothetical protein